MISFEELLINVLTNSLNSSSTLYFLQLESGLCQHQAKFKNSFIFIEVKLLGKCTVLSVESTALMPPPIKMQDISSTQKFPSGYYPTFPAFNMNWLHLAILNFT